MDSGNSFLKKEAYSRLKADTTISGMNLIGYDALNIGEGELSMGTEFLQELKDKASFPFVSANVFFEETGLPLGDQFLIKEFDGIRAGITGVIAPDAIRGKERILGDLTVENPATTLERILPELRKRSDVVIVLSHLGEKATKTLAQQVSGMDVAIVGNDERLSDQPERVGETLILKND